MRKNDFPKRQDMALGCICLYISPEIQYHVESLSTPDEAWTKLEVIFGLKEDCEQGMHEINKTTPTKKPSKDQASQFKETSTQRICTSFCSIHSR
jgi:hypothetical protein